MPKPFRLKKFSVVHSRSSMPVGMDAITLATWLRPIKEGRVLDVGTGCGIISLICAQRMPEITIEAIDIDTASVEEASLNFRLSPWGDRMAASEIDFSSSKFQSCGMKWDLIVSNPPYFNSGMSDYSTSRLRARHEAGLCAESLIEFAGNHLDEKGNLAMILPHDRKGEIIRMVEDKGMQVNRLCNIISRAGKRPKRFMVETGVKNNSYCPAILSEENLIIETGQGEYSHEFINLTKEFYLKL